MSSHDEVKLTERQWALTAAAQAFCNRGITIACPWEGDLDDEERDRFEALVSAIDSYAAILAPGAIPSTGSGETDEAMLERAAAGFEHGVTAQTQDYHFKRTPTGDWLFRCDDWFSLSDALRAVFRAAASPADPAETQAVEVGK